MKIWIFIFVVIALSSTAQAFDSDDYIEQKRLQAEQSKSELIQQIQQKQSNPDVSLSPPSQKITPVSASFKAGAGGHYFLPATINGKGAITFIADTGATSIFLTQNDAKSVGIDITDLHFDKTYNTANGQTKAAETTIRSIKVGNIELDNLPISISSQQSGQSLLGMSFFSRLSHYEVKDNTLTVYK